MRLYFKVIRLEKLSSIVDRELIRPVQVRLISSGLPEGIVDLHSVIVIGADGIHIIGDNARAFRLPMRLCVLSEIRLIFCVNTAKSTNRLSRKNRAKKRLKRAHVSHETYPLS